MKFTISRSSNYTIPEEPPVTGAVKELITFTDFYQPEETYYRTIPPFWLVRGTNHRIENGAVLRECTEYFWFINIDTMQELLDFQKSQGYPIIIIIGADDNIPNQPHIEIYDDYRE